MPQPDPCPMKNLHNGKFNEYQKEGEFAANYESFKALYKNGGNPVPDLKTLSKAKASAIVFLWANIPEEGGRKGDNKLVNNDQVPEFKMKEGETKSGDGPVITPSSTWQLCNRFLKNYMNQLL